MNKVERAIDELKQGRFVIINDGVKENEADLTIAAKHINEKKLVFLLRYTAGIVCVPMNEKDLNKVGLKKMVKNPTLKDTCNFTNPVDSIDSKTGVSAHDKYLTIKHLISGNKKKLKVPGHTFPLIARKKGVLERQGHTEASLDLIKLAKITPEAAVICELMNRKTGNPLYGKHLEEFSTRYNIPIVNVKDVIDYRRQNEQN